MGRYVAAMTGLAGQTALVTGAGSGIGAALAAALAAEGMRLFLVGRRAAPLDELAARLGGPVVPIPADLATEEGRAEVALSLPAELHVLIHSAGAYLRSPWAATTAAAWRAMDAINLHAPMLLTAACLPRLRAAAGQVVFINSTAGLTTGDGTGAYAAGKHALRAAADALRAEVNADGIRVLSMFLGRTDTPMQAEILAAEGRQAGPRALMRPQDVATMVVAALRLPRSAEVTEIVLRPMRPLG